MAVLFLDTSALAKRFWYGKAGLARGVVMSGTTTALPLPAVPPEVAAFAAKQGVTDYLPALLEMTRRIFPTVPVRVLLEEDPEIPDFTAIVFEVHGDTLDLDDLYTRREQWLAELLKIGPPAHTCPVTIVVAVK
jgi:hypothetical protein